MKTSLPRVIPLSFLALVTLVLAATQGCTSSVDEDVALAQVGQDCLVNSDCTSPFVCTFELCHTECESSRDCKAGARCVTAAKPFKVCQLEEERICRNQADCSKGLICGIDGECRDKCEDDGECLEDQRCVSGTCADRNELNEGGLLSPARGTASGVEGSPCAYVSDCSGALLCRGQICVPECKANDECSAGQACQDTRCVPDDAAPMPCIYSSQCMAPGERCLAGNCHCECVEDRDCPSGRHCDGCACELPCVRNSDCEIVGHVCLDRACSCECLTKVDCDEGYDCDGCGCVALGAPVNGIVHGNVNIVDALQLPSYANVTSIEGDLTIINATFDDLGDAFKNLRHVAGGISVMWSPNLERLSFGALQSAGYVMLSGLDSLNELDVNALSTPDFGADNLPKLQTLSLAGLTKSSLTVRDLPSLTVLNVPNVVELGALSVSGVPALNALEFGKLEKISSVLYSSGVTIDGSAAPPPAPSILSAPLLTSLGSPEAPLPSFSITGTNISSLQEFGAKGWKGYVCTAPVLDNNLQLSDQERSEFITHFSVDAAKPVCQ